jgi:hypothetical protein
MKLCDWCGEELERGSTYIVPCIGNPEKKYLRFHHECHMRQFTSSVAHIEGRCSCYNKGCTETDPPEMTRREAARAALAAWDARVSGLGRRPPH